jgi:hypothetical protein
VEILRPVDTPLLFIRSARAWSSHPRNYFEIEQISVKLGQFLFGKSLDFAWCHLAVQASALDAALVRVRNPDFSMLTEITLALMESLRTKEVEWLE